MLFVFSEDQVVYYYIFAETYQDPDILEYDPENDMEIILWIMNIMFKNEIFKHNIHNIFKYRSSKS